MLELGVSAILDVFPNLVLIALNVDIAHDPIVTSPADVVVQID